MCGIAGYVGPLRPGLGERMAATLAHRGPDDAGECVLDAGGGRSAVLAHRRLSIIDLPGGHQPQTNEDGTVQVVFNGEIYNFRELRRDARGARPPLHERAATPRCSPHLYEEHGARRCSTACAGCSRSRSGTRAARRLVLARDRLGVKPLYCAEPAGELELAFASELKALLARARACRPSSTPRRSPRTSRSCYVPHPLSAVRGVRKLPPAHVLVHEDGRSTVRPLLVARRATRPRRRTPTLWELLEEAVRLRLVADVPVGAFLSGGLDSSSIVAAAAAAGDAAGHVHRRLLRPGRAALRRARGRARGRLRLRHAAPRARGPAGRRRAAAGGRPPPRRAVRQPDRAPRVRAVAADAAST